MIQNVGKFIEKGLVPTRSVTVRATAPYFRPCFPVQWNLKLSVNSVRAWLKVVTHCHFHHVHNLHSVVPLRHVVCQLSIYRPHSHTHSLTHSLTHTLTHSLTHSLIFSQNKSLQYIQQEDPDIFCLQETKCSEDDLPKVLTVCTLVVVTVCVSNCVPFCRNSYMLKAITHIGHQQIRKDIVEHGNTSE